MTNVTKATRNEPTVGSTVGNFLGFNKKETVAGHADILNDALQTFVAAQNKLEAASLQITAQVQDHREQAEYHQNKAVEAGESLTRLERIKANIANLIA